MMRIFFIAIFAVCNVAPASADDVEIEADLDFYHDQVLYEHEGCGIKYLVAEPEINHLYIDGELVATIEYRGEIAHANVSSVLGQDSLEIDGSSDPVADYLDEVVQEYGIPPYRKLSPSSCLNS